MAVKPPDAATPGRASPVSYDLRKPARPDVQAKSSRDRGDLTDAQERVLRAQEESKHVERQLQSSIDYMKDQFERQSLSESARHETQLENQRMEGYERLRDLQRQQQKEIAKLRREGEKQLGETKEYYANALLETERGGQQAIRMAQQKSATEIQDENTQHSLALTELQADHAQKVGRSRTEKDGRMEQAAETYRQEFERIRDTSVAANQEAEKKFVERHEELRRDFSDSITKLNREGAEKLTGIRQDTSRKLAAYAERQQDPFYQLMDIGAELEDTGDAYVLRATVPVHEQANVSATLRGNNLVLSGHRRNQEKLELAPGRTQSTSAYQAFHETFPLDWPVQARQLTKEFDGDQVIVRVPKQGPFAKVPTKGAKHVERARLERPQFPDNLPLEKEPAPRDGAEATGPAKGRRGSRPLA